MDTHYNAYEKCTLCPHECGADRYSKNNGFCNTGASYSVASVCRHTGEEPVISGKNGICNIFFSHCNMQCVYCQNYQISCNKSSIVVQNQEQDVIDKICNLLDSGCHALGFVSPSHCVIQMLDMIKKLHQRKYFPVIIYNTNGYDKTSTLKSLYSLIDVYLPDFKYADDVLAYKYSKVKNYTQTAIHAISEMINQTGVVLQINNKGEASKGVIIRHLVLPGYIENSLNVLRLIAENFGNKVHVSLMSQYYPTIHVKNDCNLNRTLTDKEYDRVVDKLYKLGFENGWVQDISSSNHYVPDFRRANPFDE